MDLQGVLGDFLWDAWHVRGFSREDVSVGADEADEHAFLLRGKRGSNAHCFSLSAPGVYEDLLRAFCWLKGPGRPFGVGCLFGDLFSDVRELFGGNDRCGVIAALDFTLIGTLKGGADGDDPA